MNTEIETVTGLIASPLYKRQGCRGGLFSSRLEGRRYRCQLEFIAARSLALRSLNLSEGEIRACNGDLRLQRGRNRPS